MARAQSMNRFVDDDDYDEDALKQLNYIKDNWNKSSSQNSSINSSNNSSRNTSQEVVCTSADEVDDARVRTRSRRAKSSDKSTLEWNYTEFHMHKDGAINLKKMSLKKTPISAEDTNIGYPTKKQAKIPNDPGTKSRSTSKRSFLLIASSIVIVLSIVAWYSYNKQSYEDLEMEGNRKRCHVSRLESQFPNQRKQIWTALKFGIETTINDDPTRPSIYLFVYNDPNTVSRFMSAVTQLTRNCMEAWVDPLVLGRDQLSSSEMQNDYGVALEKYKPELSNSGVLLVNDIDRIPATVAQAFHFICDTESPLVNRLIVFTTMYIDTDDDSRKLLAHVEQNLKSNWSELASNIVDPLVTRVTDQVFRLETEFN